MSKYTWLDRTCQRFSFNYLLLITGCGNKELKVICGVALYIGVQVLNLCDHGYCSFLSWSLLFCPSHCLLGAPLGTQGQEQSEQPALHTAQRGSQGVGEKYPKQIWSQGGTLCVGLTRWDPVCEWSHGMRSALGEYPKNSWVGALLSLETERCVTDGFVWAILLGGNFLHSRI